MKKGFTLVELLGVIMLLGILSIVIIPKIGDAISNSKLQAYNAQIETIKKAANDFVIEHDDITKNRNITITLGTLKQGGYLPIKIKNPMTKKDFSNESKIIISNNYDINIQLQDLQQVSENIDSNAPILVLNGEYIQYVEVNTPYQELGAIAIKHDGTSITVDPPTIKKNGETVSQINTSNIGNYSVIYEVTASGRTVSATRTVLVRDITPPIITVPQNTTIHISELSSFDIEKDVTVTDNCSDNIDLQVNSTLSNIPGTYVITYTAIDNNNNTSTERRIVTVDGNFNNYYTNLEYLESTGTQHIMTNIPATDDTGIYAKLASLDTYNDTVYIGARKTTNSRLWIGGSRRSGNTDALYFGWNTVTASENRPAISTDDIHIVKMNYLNDRKNLFDNTTVESNLGTLSTNNIPITIFAGNDNGTIRFKSKIRLYNLKISKGSEIRYEFIPCYRKRDGKAGLYDLKNDIFYTNTGDGEFIKGEL